MGIDGFYLFIAGEIGIGIFIIMSRLNDTFDRIWDFVYPKVVFIIFSGLIPLMIWGFFAQNAAYQKAYSKPSWYERRVAQDKIMMDEAIKKLEAQELQSVQEKEEYLPHTPETFERLLPIQELIEGGLRGKIL